MKKLEIRKCQIVDLLLALLLFLMCFTMFSAMRRSLYFLDELDNFANGLQIAKGALLYRDIFSQHMPLMYYLCALMAKLGIHTILGFRLAWYTVLAGCYTAVFWRYKKHFGRTPLLLWPIFYLLAVSTQSLCFAILSEQLQAVGIVILVLEFLQFCSTREIPWDSAVAIALSINLAFLSAFIALFSCAAIVCAYIIWEIFYCVKQKMHFGKSIFYLWKKYWLTIVLTLLPIAILMLYYATQGALHELIYFTFSFNTEVYSKYIGIGESPIAAITGAFHLFGLTCRSAFDTLLGDISDISFATALLLVGKDLLLLGMVRKREWTKAVVLQLCFILCGVRGFFNFHALQTLSFVALSTALFVGQLWIFAKSNSFTEKSRAFKLVWRGCSYGVIVLMIGLVLYGNNRYFWDRRDDLYPTAWELEPKYSSLSNEGLLAHFAEPDEYILQNINGEGLYITTDVRMAPYSTGASPWAWEATRERSMQLLAENPPRFAIFDPDYTVFKAFVVRDYAPELTAFIYDNYRPLEIGGDHLWIRNDWITKIEKELGKMQEYVPRGDTLAPIFSSSGTVFEQRFVAEREALQEITIRPATFGTSYDGTITFELWEEGQEKIAAWSLRGKDIKDSAPQVLYQKDFSEDRIALTPGKTYCLKIQPQSPSGAANFSLWMRQAPGNACQAWMNGEPQPYNYDIILI